MRERSNKVNIYHNVKNGKAIIFSSDAVLSKFVGPVGQSDISYECPTKNVRVSHQMSDRKYKNIHLVEEKKRNTSSLKRLTIRLYIISLFLEALLAL